MNVKKILSAIIAGTMAFSVMNFAVQASDELQAGSYDADWNMIYSWDELMEKDLVKYGDEVGYGDEYADWLCYVDPEMEYIVIDGETVDTIHGAFGSHENIKEVIINEGVKAIGNKAFYRAPNLSNVEIPESMETIGHGAFQGTALKEVTVRNDIEYGVRTSGTPLGASSLYTACNNLKNIVIEDGVETVLNRMFESCYGLEKVVIPASVTSIEDKAFNDCLSLGTVVILSNEFALGSQVFDKNNTATAEYGNCPVEIIVVNEEMKNLVESKLGGNGKNVTTVTVAVAEVNGEYYSSLQDAVDAVEEGETITLLSDVVVDGGSNGISYTRDASFTLDLNDYTFTANTTNGAIRLNNNNDGVTKPVEINIKNGTVVAGSSAYCALITTGKNDETKLTVNTENVEFKGSNPNGSVIKVFSDGIVNLNEGTVLTAEDSYGAIECMGEINIYDGVEIYQNGTTSYVGCLVGVSTGGVANVYGGKGVSASAGMIVMTSGGTLNVYGGDWAANNGDYGEGNKSVLISQSANNAKSTINVYGGNFTGGYNCYGNAVGDAEILIAGGYFSENPEKYVVDGYDITDLGNAYKVTDKVLDTTGISVYFRPVANDVASEKVYEIVLKAADGQEIYEWASADLTFALESDTIEYSIEADEKITLTKKGKDRYMFNMDGINEYERTDNEVVIGKVTFAGYGSFSFAVADETTNVVMATEVADSIAKEFTVGGENELTIDADDIITDNDDDTDDLYGAIEDEEIAVPQKKLTINVTFNNKINDNEAEYQAMWVVISGGDLKSDIVKNFGTDENALNNGVYTVEADLTEGIVYNVTVTGAGYRTAKYAVEMNANKTLNFWNNVKDVADEIEDGVSASTQTTFLAGDIVADNVINVYDLSAVVSYFGTEANTANNFAMYDLNRDKMIDSRDVAYVLVSWGK